MEKICFRNVLGSDAKVVFLRAVFQELNTDECIQNCRRLKDIAKEAEKGNLLDEQQVQIFENVARALLPISLEERNPEKIPLVNGFKEFVIEALARE